MQLKQLKLAGFKSFVDPTVLDFPSSLVAVVGPNGCGKSNIIDAIRWVMGESSAKHLRGESMVDVIFNGSSHRKPLGQASVELIFDNKLGRLSGPYSSYGEVSIKRIVTRDGDSSYYLNGTKCRRRDVIDLFLGTGAGVQGYSIIRQGTVSQIIEAKPEELRAYFEEAAGVSKYKERRRETLNRIQHTRENLVQVNYIREELSKQLEKLNQQTETALHYKKLKADEKLCRSQIIALKWQDLAKKQATIQNDLSGLEQQKTDCDLKNIQREKEQTLSLLVVQEFQEKNQELQEAFYKAGLEITRMQENLSQDQKEAKRLDLDKEDIEKEQISSRELITQYQANLKNLEEQKEESDRSLVEGKEALYLQEENFQKAKTLQKEKEKESQNIRDNFNAALKNYQLTDLNLKNKEQRLEEIKLRIEKIQQEQSTIACDLFEEEKDKLKQEQEKIQTEKADNQNLLDIQQSQIENLSAEIKKLAQKRQELQDNYYKLTLEHAALKARQNIALSPDAKDYPLKEWANKPRLVSQLVIEKEWQFALESVLGDNLKALIIEDWDDFFKQLEPLSSIGEQGLNFSPQTKNTSNFVRLSDRISGLKPNTNLNLDLIFTLDSLDEALKKREILKENESFLTKEGYWLGKGFLRIPKLGKQEEPGLLEREEQIQKLSQKLLGLEADQTSIQKEKEALEASFADEEQNFKNIQKLVQNLKESLLEIASKQKINEERLIQSRLRLTNLQEENERLLEDLEQNILEKNDLEAKQKEYEILWKKAEIEQDKILLLSKASEEDLSNQQKALDKAKTDMHQKMMEQERILNRIQQIKEGLEREALRLKTFEEKIRTLITKKERLTKDTLLLEENLTKNLSLYQDLDLKLKNSQEDLLKAKENLELHNTHIKELASQKIALEKRISQKQIEEEATKVRLQNLQDNLKEQAINLSEIFPLLTETMRLDLQEKQLSVIMEAIQALGAINLAAIEEQTEVQKRHEHLGLQCRDLEEALNILETAIEKMDKETKMRLANTFEQVNALFQALFPRLFGGGRAILEWTSENVLEAGIVVMAQPPGKRNSTIHLLSGGEKAMTAIALVFAIFQLNPSPFCMLDEVDAPLDDANVLRFCNVVKEMSKFVQFLFITHNKVTMELAEQLIGVTMWEPGVSRLVTVDINDLTLVE